MNIVIFASDSKGVASVADIARELKGTVHNYFFLYSQETQLQYPSAGLNNFSYDSNIAPEKWEGVWSDSLNVHLPFTPEILVLQRDCWQPEQSIIHEFKTKWKSKVALVEVNTHLVNNPETILEMHSRTKYPQNQIDVYFEQSEFTKQERGKSGFNISKSVVTGNPKFDSLLKGEIEYCYEKYNLDRGKIQILFYSLINTSRKEMFKCLENLVEKVDHDKYEILFKPYPGEPYNEKFKSQFFPFIYDKVKVIYDDVDIYPLARICDVHIGAISSVMHFPLILGKRTININNVCTYLDNSSLLEKYLQETGNGVEDSARFWMMVHGLRTYEEFLTLVNPDRVSSYGNDIEYFLSAVRESTIDYDFDLECLQKEIPSPTKLLKLFDEYNDFNAAKRIIVELEKFGSQ